MSNDLQKAIDKRRSELARFDSLSLSEQIRLREQGLDPREAPAVRKSKQAKVWNELKTRLPKEARSYLMKLGWFSNDANNINRRETGELSTGK